MINGRSANLAFRGFVNRVAEPRRTTATGYVTAFTPDSNGVTSSMTVDVNGQSVPVSSPAGLVNVYTGMPVQITNYGSASAARWQVAGTGGFSGASGGSIGSTGILAETVVKTGYTIFSHGTSLVYDVSIDGTYIITRLNIFDDNEQVALSDINGYVEHMRIDGAAEQIIDPDGYVFYKYNVDRFVYVSPAGSTVGWSAGTLINGLTDKGYIVVDNRHNAINSPRLSAMYWTSGLEPGTKDYECYRLGNLNGVASITDNDHFGFAVGELSVSSGSYLLFDSVTGETTLRNSDIVFNSVLGDEVVRIYGKGSGERSPGDYDFGKVTSVHETLNTIEETWGVYRGTVAQIEVTMDHTFIKDLVTIGDPVAARITLGEEDNRSVIALRNRYGAVRAVLSTDEDGNAFAYIGNPPPEANSVSYDGATNTVTVDGHVVMRSADVVGRLQFAETGEFKIIDPDDPGRFGVTTPRGQYAYTTDGAGTTHLIRVDAWGPLVLEDVLGSGEWRTWVGGSQIFGDPRYRHFRIERGATARAGLFNGETPVAYMDATGKGYFTGEVTMESGLVSGDILITDGGMLTFDAISGKFDGGGIRWEKSGTEYLRIGTQVDLGSVVGNIVDSHTVDLSLYSDGSIYIIPGIGQQTIIGGMSYGESGSNYTAFSKTGDITLVGTATFTSPNGIIGPSWKPASDSTTALQLQNAAGDYVLNVDTSNKLIGIGTDMPAAKLHVKGSSSLGPLLKLSDTKVGYERDWSFSAEDSIFDIKDITAGNLIRLAILSNGNVGIGTTAPATLLHTLLASAATNAVTNVLTIGHNTSGTASASFGSRVLWELESSTTADQSAAALDVIWTDATHATRTSKVILSGTRSGTLYELAAFSGAEGVVLNETGESWADFRVEGDTATHLLFVDASADAVGIGTSAPGTRFHVLQTSADAGIRDIMRITHNSTGTPAKGFGVAIALAAELDGAENVVAGRLAAAWDTVGTEDYTGDLIGYASDAAGDREGWRVRASGSAAMLGLFGATPVLRPTTSHAAASFTANSGTAVNDASTFDGYTIKQVVKALRDLGALT